MKLIKEIWNFLGYLVIGNDELLFEPERLPFPYSEPACQVIDITTKGIPYAETGRVDHDGTEHHESTVYQCENCNHLVEIPDHIKRPQGQDYGITSDVDCDPKLRIKGDYYEMH